MALRESHIERVSDSLISCKQINEFISSNSSNRFGSIPYFRDNFDQCIKRLYDSDLFIVLTDEGGIQGVCGWCLVSKDNENDINKGRWVLPDEIEHGNILYVAVCVLNEGCNMWKVREFFNDLTRENNIGEALWFSKTWIRRKLNRCAFKTAAL